MNNLKAERVLFAFAEGTREDYPFRLNNPGPAASGQRFAIADAAVAPDALCCCDNRAAIDSQHRVLDAQIVAPLVLTTMVSQM